MSEPRPSRGKFRPASPTLGRYKNIIKNGLTRVLEWSGISRRRFCCNAVLVLCAALWPSILPAQIPKIAELPDTMPTQQRQKLSQERESLVVQKNELVKQAGEHNSKCSAVPKDTPEWKNCSDEQSKLEAGRNRYIDAVNRFNRAVEQAHCSQIAELQNQFESLTQQINLDRQVVQNFGFEKTVAQIEYWGSLPERQVEDAKDAFKTVLFDATLGSVGEAAGAVGSLTSEEVDALNRLADIQGAPPLGIVAGARDVHKALEFLDRSKLAYEGAEAVRKGQMLDAAVKLGSLASKNPAFSLLLRADGWAAYQVYQSATAVKTVHDLTKVNEGDLILLKSRSEKLKNEVNQLTGVKKQVAELSSKCDSTGLVEKPE